MFPREGQSTTSMLINEYNKCSGGCRRSQVFDGRQPKMSLQFYNKSEHSLRYVSVAATGFNSHTLRAARHATAAARLHCVRLSLCKAPAIRPNLEFRQHDLRFRYCCSLRLEISAAKIGKLNFHTPKVFRAVPNETETVRNSAERLDCRLTRPGAAM